MAISEGRMRPPDEHRHIGLVVGDREAMRRAVRQSPEVLKGMDLEELRRRSLAPEP